MSMMLYLPLGIFAGILLRRFMLSIKSGNHFASSVLPTLIASQGYAQALILKMQVGSEVSNELKAKQLGLEKALTSRKGMYPEWVYKVGFNPGLRAGTRMYLIRIERMVELLISTAFLSSIQVDEEMVSVMQTNQELMSYIISYFSGNRMMMSEKDYRADIEAMERTVSQRVPVNFELLDLSPGYLDILALARNLKDLRQVLLSLVSSLPA